MFRASTACTFLTESVSFHNCRHVLGISTSKSCPRASVFNRFDSRMCFAPQLHALFEHLNFQKCSEAEVLCAVWLSNVLHAITACNFWSLISPDGSALASLLFDPPEPQNIKAQCFAAFLPFRTPCSSFLLSFSLPWSSAFFLFFNSSYLYCCICPCVGSLTSKLPSINWTSPMLILSGSPIEFQGRRGDGVTLTL